MDVKLNAKAVIGLIWLFSPFACANSEGGARSRVMDAWRSEKTVVLIINAKEGVETEQYADWSYYLNEFASAAGGELCFKKIAKDNEVFRLNGYDEPYSILFFNKTKKRLFL